MEMVANTLMLVGFVGVLVAAILNTYVAVGRRRPSAMLFASGWWSVWFPMYAVMSTIAFVGVVLTLSVA